METALNDEGLTLEEKLDRLYALRIERYGITEKLDKQIAMLEQEKKSLCKDIDPEISQLEVEIKDECIGRQESVEGTYLQVLFRKGASLVDVKALRDCEPEIAAKFATAGNPSARIAEIKK